MKDEVKKYIIPKKSTYKLMKACYDAGASKFPFKEVIKIWEETELEVIKCKEQKT